MKDMMKKKESAKNLDMDAKKASIIELLDLAKNMMKDRVGSDMNEMQKVTVAAPDKESLLSGLEKAEDVLGEMPESDELSDMEEVDEEDEDEEDYA